MTDDGMSWGEKALLAAETGMVAWGAIGPGNQGLIQDQFGIADPTPPHSIVQEIAQEQLEGLGELKAQHDFDELNNFGAPDTEPPGPTPPL